MTGLAAALVLVLGAGDPPGTDVAGPAGDAVRRSIAHHGGMAAWAAKTSVQFRKTTTRFGKDGKVDRRMAQFHRYVLRPRLRARIEWEEDGKQVVLINDVGQAVKYVDGRLATAEADVNQARSATFGSHYVFNMPFKLADPGAQLAPAGRRRLPDGTLVDAVRVTYAPGAGDAAGMHTWTYFLDARNGRLTANHLMYGPGQYEYTEYHDDVVVDGITVARRRLGFGADGSRRKGTRTSEIVYEDVKFDVPLDARHFASRPAPGALTIGAATAGAGRTLPRCPRRRTGAAVPRPGGCRCAESPPPSPAARPHAGTAATRVDHMAAAVAGVQSEGARQPPRAGAGRGGPSPARRRGRARTPARPRAPPPCSGSGACRR